ncbi:hypothetical protein D3C71_24420 [compost metagenome]
MGYSVAQYLVVGYIVEQDEASVEISKAGCKHVVSADHKFCGKCGAAATRVVQESILEDGQVLGEDFQVTCFQQDEPRRFAVGILGRRSSEDVVSLNPGDLDFAAVRDALREALVAEGITPNESTFGVHSVLRHSY